MASTWTPFPICPGSAGRARPGSGRGRCWRPRPVAVIALLVGVGDVVSAVSMHMRSCRGHDEPISGRKSCEHGELPPYAMVISKS